MQQLLSAVSYCHSQMLMHRDIKPENVIMSANGTVKLIDFGLATTSRIPSQTMVGTPYYMAPEVMDGYIQ